MSGACWFLSALFMVTISVQLIDFAINKINQKNNHIIHVTWSAVLFVISFFFIEYGFRSSTFEHLAAGCFLFAMGMNIAKLKIKILSKKIWTILFFVTFIFLAILNLFGTVDLATAVYTSPLFFIVASLSGWFMLYSFSKIILNANVLCTILVYLGKNTICIVGLHFLAFKLFTYIRIILYSMPAECLSDFPVLGNVPNPGGSWWIGYTIFGVVTPLMINHLYKNVKKKFFTIVLR